MNQYILLLIIWIIPAILELVLIKLILNHAKGSYKLIAFIPLVAYIPVLVILLLVLSGITDFELPTIAWVVYNYFTVAYSFCLLIYVMSKKKHAQLPEEENLNNSKEVMEKLMKPRGKN